MPFQKLQRFFKIDQEKLRRSDRLGLLWLDVIMVILVVINLLLWIFDWSFQYDSFRFIIRSISEPFDAWYAVAIHPRASYLDLIFVAVFFTEFMFRWIRAIVLKRQSLWWFYPFTHWYDVLGMIPMNGTFKLLRLFRIFGMIFKLQRLGVIDLRSTQVYKLSKGVSDIFVEEVSDRVVVKVLDMVQAEIEKGGPVAEQIVRDVIKPREEVLANYLANRISEAIKLSYFQYRPELKEYVHKILSESIRENKEIDALRYLPGLGKVFQQMLDSAVSDITFNTIDKLMSDLADPNNTRGIKEITHGVIETFLDNEHPEQGMANYIMINTMVESLDVVKSHVMRKDWQENMEKKGS
jgi:hypothetical protein